MKKIFLIKNQEVFQGVKKINTDKNYFEGWYFKNTNDENGMAFIPGININGHNKNVFIQVITTDSSYFINYDINEFKFSYKPFYIKIGNNFFSKNKVDIDIKDDDKNLIIKGSIRYSNNTNIKKNLLNPNIMGLFSYIPFMECNHAIISMKSRADGVIDINNRKIVFENGIGYIEKDWGCSFPTTYIWCQGNNFQKRDASFMLSIANIPFEFFKFRGIICTLIVDNHEFRFATYNNTKLIEYDILDESLNITIKKGCYYLNIKSKYDNNCGFKLSAPIKGKMEKEVLESITATVNVTLKKKDTVIFSDTSTNCGIEIVQ